MNAALQELHDATGYYTREPVVDELLDLLRWPQCGGRLLDPGAGDGAFIIRAVQRLALRTDDIIGLLERVSAWEIHDGAVLFAREALATHLRARGWLAHIAAIAALRAIRHADFLMPGPVEGRFRVAAGNPPYLRCARLPAPLKRRYLKSVPDWARSDLLHAFLARSSDLLEDGGRIAFVTADRWLFNESAGALREQLGQRFGVESARRLDVASSFYQAKTRRKGTPPRIHPVAVLLGPDAPRLSRSPVYFETPDVPADARPLGDVATIRLAPWLGPAGIYVISADARMLKGLPRESFVPCVDTDDIVGGILARPWRVALRADRNEKPPLAVRRHLARHRAKLSARARLAQRSCAWAPPETWGPLPHASVSLLVPRIARELVTVRLPAGVLPINHNLTVVSARVSVEQLERALHAPAAREWIAAHAPRLEGGFLSITTNLLRRLPVVLT